MTIKSNRTFVDQLIKAGREEAKNIQEIKSVAAATPSVEINPPETKATKEIPDIVDEEPVVQKESSKTSTKGLVMLLAKRDVKDSEAVKIPRELHRELKVLASMSGITMMQMLGNLIEDFFNQNQKEITSYKRNFLNGK